MFLQNGVTYGNKNCKIWREPACRSRPAWVGFFEIEGVVIADLPAVQPLRRPAGRVAVVGGNPIEGMETSEGPWNLPHW